MGKLGLGLELRVTVINIRYVILVLCPRGFKLRKVGNPTVTPALHKMTSSIFALYIISATKFVSCSLRYMYKYMNVRNKQGLGLARLGSHTRVRVTDLGLGLESRVRVRATHTMTK